LNNLNNIFGFISNDIKPVDISDSISDISQKFLELNFNTIPVVNGKQTAGLITKEDLIGLEESNDKLSDHSYIIDKSSCFTNDKWMTIFKQIIEKQHQLIPVSDENGNYNGYYESLEIIGLLSESPALMLEGQELIISHNSKDFSHTKISQIIEENGGEVLLSSLLSKTETKTFLHIKIQTLDLNDILQVLRAQGFQVLSKHTDDKYMDELKDRSQYLDKFLNV
jgi:CBS domain containing-hemolysin-like protein